MGRTIRKEAPPHGRVAGEVVSHHNHHHHTYLEREGYQQKPPWCRVLFRDGHEEEIPDHEVQRYLVPVKEVELFV